MADQLKTRGFEVIGADLGDEWQFPDIPFVRTDLDEPLPFNSDTFDAAMMIEALSYLENPSHMIRELHRVLRPGGAVVLTIPNIFALQSRLRFLFKGTFRWFPHPIHRGEDKLGHTNTYRDPLRLTTLLFYLERAGLEVERVVFGGRHSYSILLPVGLLLKGLLAMHNALAGPKKKQAPAVVNSLPALFYTHVGVVAHKKPVLSPGDKTDTRTTYGTNTCSACGPR